MVDPLLPENCTLYLSGSNITFKVRDFSETGGELQPVRIRTFGRNFRRYNEVKTDYEISMEVALYDSTFLNTINQVGTVGSIRLDYPGSFTLSYYNAYAVKLSPSLNADEHQKATLTFSCAPYDSAGNDNRVGSSYA